MKKIFQINIETALKIIYFALPLITLLIGIYFIVFRTNSNTKILQTKEDVGYIVQNIHNKFNGTYTSQIESNVVVADIIPYDLKTSKTPIGYKIYNRFGGRMFFYDAFNTKEERDSHNYISDKSVSAYIILLTHLSKKECISLSTTDWRKVSPHFIGLEASYLAPNKIYNGVYNLRNYILLNNFDEKYTSKDEGTISRKRLNLKQAKSACACTLKSCTFSLKFN